MISAFKKMLFFIIIVILTGCFSLKETNNTTSNQIINSPKQDSTNNNSLNKDNLKVGLAFIIDDKPKYINSAGDEQTLPFDWHIQEILTDYIFRKAKALNISITPVKIPDYLYQDKQSSGVLQQHFINAFAAENRVNKFDYLIIISARTDKLNHTASRLDAVLASSKPKLFEGYGLYTECLLGICTTSTMNNFGITIYNPEYFKLTQKELEGDNGTRMYWGDATTNSYGIPNPNIFFDETTLAHGSDIGPIDQNNSIIAAARAGTIMIFEKQINFVLSHSPLAK